MTTSMVHSRSMLAKVIAESPSPFIIPIFCPNVIKIIFLSINYFLKLESTQKDRSRYQLWLFFTKISFKQLHEERFEYFQVSNS